MLWELIKFVHFPIWIKRDLLALLCLVVIALIVWLARQARRTELKGKRVPTLALGRDLCGNTCDRASLWFFVSATGTCLLALDELWMMKSQTSLI